MTERRRNIETMPSRRTSNRTAPKTSSGVTRTTNSSSQSTNSPRQVNKRRTAPVSSPVNSRRQVNNSVNQMKAEPKVVDKPSRVSLQDKSVVYNLIKDKGIDFTKDEHDYYVEIVLKNLEESTPPILHHIDFPEELYTLLENLVISVSQQPASKESINRKTERSRRRHE